MINVKTLKKTLQVLDNNNNLILTGKHNKSDGLWDIPLTLPSRPSQADNVLFFMNNRKR